MKIKALVVDNNPVLLKAVSTILEQEGCQVVIAVNGLEAVDIAKKEYPDIIFTDLIMPLVDGEQLCKIIRGSIDLQDIYLVILSAVVREERERILAAIDYDLCIAKGNLKDLRLHLREALEKFRKRESTPETILGDTGQFLEDEDEINNIARELLSEKHHLKEMLENLKEGIVELSRDGKIVSINRAASEIFDTQIEKLTGVHIADIAWTTHAKRIADWADVDLLNQRGAVLEITETDPLRINGTILTGNFLPITKKGSSFAICILRDITRQHLAEKRKTELEKALRLVKKMDAMSSMAGGVAHDFNNLLTVICGSLDMISFEGKEGNLKETLDLVENAREATHITVELVRKISCFSPFGIIKRENICIEDLVGLIINDFSKNKEAPKCFFEQHDVKRFINIDAQQIRIAIENVLQNSFEAGSDGGIEINIEDEVITEPSLRAGQYVSSGHYVKILFSDKGSGIDSENLLEIFDPYFSTKERGTSKGMGLGLTIVFSTLRNHGGYVVVESEAGKGTDVTFYMPFQKTGSTREDNDLINQKQILLLEDDDQLRAISKIMLEYLGYSVFEVSNKQEAIEVFSENMGKKSRITIAILNLMGSSKQDGVEICKVLHQIDKELQVIVSSGLLLEPAMINFREYGFCKTLNKPYTLDDLRNVLASL